MITQDAITAIMWGEDTTYKDLLKKSWIYQWLNEDFLDTLYNQENIIVQNAKWNATKDENDIPAKPLTDESATIVEGNVGLLNVYEYYQAYKKANTSTNYLNIGYIWWLITPYNNSDVMVVIRDGSLSNYSSTPNAYGVRPSINLKSDITISAGNGTKENPYRIERDKKVAKVNDKLNNRISGEYVNFDGKKYRIVGIENETTKLTSVDYVRDDSGIIIAKNFSSGTTNYGEVGTSTDYWAGYLKNTWYNNINQTYKNMLVEGTYYLGIYSDGMSYKNTLCSVNNTVETIKTCEKISSTWKGYVGLPRVGEMFSAMLGNGYNDTTIGIWLITPYNSSGVRGVSFNGFLNLHSPITITFAVRPSITLNSNVYITDGDGMSPDTAYEIAM